MKPTADNVALILNQFFDKARMMLQGHNIPDGRSVVTVNRANKGLTTVSISGNAEYTEVHDGLLPGELPMIYTLKHYPGDRETPPETIETPFKKYKTAEGAARGLIDFWVEEYFEWGLESLEPEGMRG
jgi:hypothetical protein